MTRLAKPLSALLLLVVLVTAAMAGGPSNGLEAAVMEQLASVRAEWPAATAWTRALTALGGVHVTLGLAGFCSFYLLLRRAPRRALLLASTVLLERLLVEALKDWVGRPRPPFELDWLPHSLAYPSGHAANSMTAFLATALIAAPPAWRRLAALAAVTISIIVGLTRIILGVHWPSDVIGGWALGLLAVGLALAVGERSGVLPNEPQHEVVGRHRLPSGEDEAA